MPLLRVNDLGLAYGHHVLLEEANIQLFKGDRICLVGRNGAGKSTLMKLVEGVIKPDSGSIWKRPSVRISRLEQELPKADEQTVMQVVASGLQEIGDLIAEYDQLIAQQLDDAGLKKMEQLQHQIEAKDGWSYQQRIDEVLSRLALPADKVMSTLSGGWRRRVALAKVLVTAPDLLLLDEPTNHLDIETIEWLEKQLLDFKGAVLFITHDRALVRRLATKIIELDRGHLQLFQCGYDNYLEERAHLLVVEEQQNALFDKKLAQEEVWIRQGIKARRTRNEGRVRALKKLREERSQRRNVQGAAKIAVEAASKSGKLVAEANRISHEFDGNVLIKDLSFNIIRGDKIGLLGPNGVGKTTLLKIILGELAPSSGTVKLGSKLDVAYFDQMRDQLDDEKTIVDVVGQGRESIDINGKSRHILSYLSDFLFSPERSRTPLKALSGGERNRVQLALLFSMPANILVLDEPTNDLDVETLELLEAVLVDFAGTILLVSHDRDFMDNVVTGTLAFEGSGTVQEYVGGYKDWLRQGGAFTTDTGSTKKPAELIETPEARTATKKPAKKLGYKDQRELELLPEQIETLEQQQEKLTQETTAADFYQQEHSLVTERLEALATVTNELETCYERWVELSEG
ncbi:MAG: ATP-binding cassette domain-containing protein [Oceanicoccus sp.]|uniref:ATP-binding cassette domain-containing protein n=1 Tax=Oceanicoccus sp. TaxID=2691044 RepID=UPI002627C112|nr:ATP-binding cassette domain-containing protein [Oceanicoccus sp.]MCP3907700.1 ATP-binding cassette domain-containing protein [Oceanicoccus sp.]